MTSEEDELYHEFNESEKKRNLKEKMFGGGESYQERKYLQELNDKDRREIEGIASRKVTQAPGTLGHEFKDYASTGVRGIAKAPREKLRTWTEDYSAEKQGQKAYEEGKRNARFLKDPRLLTASEKDELVKVLKDVEPNKPLAYYRGAAEGIRLETRKLRQVTQKENDRREREIKKLNREEGRKDISVSANKAYRIAKAQANGKIAAMEEKITRQEMREQFSQQYAQQSIPQQPQRRMVPFFSYEGGRAVDPLNIYSLPKQRQPQNQQQNQFRQPPQQQPPQQAPNLDWMHYMLGYGNNPHGGQPRKKTYNIFKGIWE
jgi:hypothetical protein